MSTNVSYIRGNIFTSCAQSIVNTVNCVGVMGAGIALEFKYRYPEMFRRYVQFCKDGNMKIGYLYIYDIPDTGRKVINFPTKNDWKNPSKMEYLEKGLNKFLETYRERGVISAAFPLLGAQNGGLDPVEVRSLMTDYLGSIDIPIEIYEYSAESNDDLVDGFIDGLLYNKSEFKHSTGLSDSQIDKLREVISSNDLTSLIGLTKVKGIGEETIKACFQFAMRAKAGKITEQALFKGESDTHSLPYVAESDIVYDRQDEGSDGGHREKNNTVPSSDETSGHAVGKSGKGKKPAGGSRKPRTVKTLSMGEKQLLTNLSEEVIEKIEAGKEDVTISQLKSYAAGMKIKPKKFITDKYLANSASQP